MGLKSFYCYNEARLCGGSMYSLYVDAVVLLTRYVCMYVICQLIVHLLVTVQNKVLIHV
jgi:hypothetical protein